MARRAARIGWVVLSLALLVPVVITPLGQHAQAAFAGILLALAWLVARLKGRLASLVLVGASLLATARYLVWRTTQTLDMQWSLEAGIGALLLGAEVYSGVALALGYLQSVAPLKRRVLPLPEDPATWPAVDVYIPTCNEPLAVIRPTILAAQQLDWPADKLRVWLLDDGKRLEVAAFAAEAGVGYLTRAQHLHGKAGNLNAALKQTTAPFVAVFDCDHVPTRSFLQVTMGWLVADAGMALVQTPHHFQSPDPLERNLSTFRRVPNEGDVFYGLLQQGNDSWNAACFSGSCAVLRKSALDQVGGFAVETVTGDAHTSLRLHRAGFRSAYLDIPQASGLTTDTLAGHVGQRIRWSRGMVQILRLDFPLLGRGLSLGQRLCYLGATAHFLFAVPRLVFLLAPLCYLLGGAHIFNAAPGLVLAYALPHLLQALLTNSRLQGRFHHSFWAEVYETALAPWILLPTLLALVDPRLGRFNVSQKALTQDDDRFDRRIAAPYLLLLALEAAGLVSGLVRLLQGLDDPTVVAVNMAWTLYNTLVVGATVAVAFERRQRRGQPRVDLRIPASVRLDGMYALGGETRDVSTSGAAVQLHGLAAVTAGDLLTLTLWLADEAVPLPARVVAAEGRDLRLAFEPLTLEQESGLVRAVFDRPAAWLDWRQEAPDQAV